MEGAPIGNTLKKPPIPNKKPISEAALRIKEAREKYKNVGKDPYLTPRMS